MSDKDQVLAEVFDSLVKQGKGRDPAQARELLKLGLRLYDECPDIDAAFMERLGLRLEEEPARPQEASARVQRVPRALTFRHLLPPALVLRVVGAIAIVLVALALSLALSPGWRSEVQAGLGRVITLFRNLEIEQKPRSESTPPRILSHRSFATIAQAEAAVGRSVLVPKYLPAGVKLRRATVTEADDGVWVTLFFEGSAGMETLPGREVQDALIVRELLTTATVEQVIVESQVGEESAEYLQIAGRPAVWAAGEWNGKGRWARSSRTGVLFVQEGDIVALMWGRLGREETIRVAESMLE